MPESSITDVEERRAATEKLVRDQLIAARRYACRTHGVLNEYPKIDDRFFNIAFVDAFWNRGDQRPRASVLTADFAAQLGRYRQGADRRPDHKMASLVAACLVDLEWVAPQAEGTQHLAITPAGVHHLHRCARWAWLPWIFRARLLGLAA